MLPCFCSDESIDNTVHFISARDAFKSIFLLLLVILEKKEPIFVLKRLMQI